MALPLFVYGTLRDPDLLPAVLGRPLPPGSVHDAVASGFRAVHYPGRIYPALVRAPGGSAPGLLLTGLTPFERDLLDAFEGEEYLRGTVPVMVGEELHEADAYLPAIGPGQRDRAIPRAIVPPSSGTAGSRLMHSSLKLMEAASSRTSLSMAFVTGASGSVNSQKISLRTAKPENDSRARLPVNNTRLLIGPAAAVRNSDESVGPGCVNANPPNGQIRISSPSPKKSPSSRAFARPSACPEDCRCASNPIIRAMISPGSAPLFWTA